MQQFLFTMAVKVVAFCLQVADAIIAVRRGPYLRGEMENVTHICEWCHHKKATKRFAVRKRFTIWVCDGCFANLERQRDAEMVHGFQRERIPVA